MMNHIVNNLWLGGQHDADELVHNNPENITAILNVRGPDAYKPAGRNQAAEHPGKAYKFIPAPDTGLISPKHVKEALIWLREQTEDGQRILIHCKYGISRSPGFLAVFLVESGISLNLEGAKAMISLHRGVQPATQIVEYVKPVVLISALTGLPNRQAFDDGDMSPFVAVADVEMMRVFNEIYGDIPGDALLRRLGGILTSSGLDAYHQSGNTFLCKGATHQELSTKLSQSRQTFREAFQMYADGRIQTIEGTNFCFGIATTIEDAERAMLEAKRERPKHDSPEWVRKSLESGGR